MRAVNPDNVNKPRGPYVHGILIDPGRSWFWISGQIAVRPDGSIPEAIEDQTDVVWSNIRNILAEVEMDISHIVKVTTYLTSADDMAAYARIREGHLGTHRPTSTLVVVSALANPRFRVEVEAVAAK